MLRRAFVTNSSGILFSRVFGFIRDLATASILGASIYSDAFFVAFKLPNLFRRVFGEGAFNQAFLPSFVAARHKGAFVLAVGMIFLVLLTILSFFVLFFSPWVTKILAWGFNAEEIAIAAPLVAINFWYLLLVFVVTFFGAILQYKQNFTASAYSTVFLNLAMIVALILAREQEAYVIVTWLSWGVLVGGVLQILLHLYPFYRLGFFKMLLAGRKHLVTKRVETLDSLKRFFRQFFPAMLGASTAQIAAFIDTILASFLASGSISYLYYANRIFQLPLAVFAIAISVALFPAVARSINQNRQEEALKALERVFWFLFMTLSFATVGGVLLSREIIWLLFERGSFSRVDTLQSAQVLAAYLLGLLPFGMAKIFSLWLYSHGQQTLAAKISAKSLLVGTLFSLILMQFWGVRGLALAGSLSGFFLLWWTLRAFGFSRCVAWMRNPKAWLLWLGILLGEVALIVGVRAFFDWEIA